MKYLTLILLLTGCTTTEVVKVGEFYRVEHDGNILECKWEKKEKAVLMKHMIIKVSRRR